MSNSSRAVPFADLMVSLGVETTASPAGRHRARHSAGIGRMAATTLAGAAIASGAALSATPTASAQSSDLDQVGQMVQEVGAQHGIGAEQVRAYASQIPGLDQLGLGSLQLPGSVDAHKPTDGVVTSSFGPRWGSNHSGTDFVAPIGTPLYAAKSGTVVASGPAAGYGLWIRIQTDDGYLLEYGHNNANYVSVGERVTAGR